MDALAVWKIIRALFSLGAIAITTISIIAVWRLRGVLHWQRSLGNEMQHLRESAETTGGSRRQALELVLQACQSIKTSTSMDLNQLTDLMTYIRSIAACYHRKSERPELQIKVGRALRSIRQSLDRLDQILRRPGFKKLQRIKLRHIRQSLEWYERLRHSKIVKLIRAFGDYIKSIYWLRLFIIPDVFTWLAYFSNRLTLLILTKCLMIDIYLFVGTISIDAYEITDENNNMPNDIEVIENALEEIHLLKPSEIKLDDPQILKIRDKLVGVDRMLISTPGLSDLKKSVIEAAEIIAQKYFPEAEKPLEEAALGPLLKRCQSWLYSICESKNWPVVNRFHGIRLITLFEMKSFSDTLLSEQMKVLAKMTRDVYRWIKWPLKIYRWIKRTSPVQMTLNLGWIIVKKSFINYIFRYSFDTACKELENVYSQSV